MAKHREVVVRVSGIAGGGIISVGELVTQAAAQLKLHTLTFESYGAEVRGGKSLYQVKIGGRPVLDPSGAVDLLLALEGESSLDSLKEVRPGGIVIYDPESGADITTAVDEKQGLELFEVPLGVLVRQIGARPQAKNMVALGVSGLILGLPLEQLKAVAYQRFGDKGESVMAGNIAALQAGYDFAADVIGQRFSLAQMVEEEEERVLMAGNQAIALGALAAGLEVFAGYPITPATEIMELLARELPRFGGHMVQTEDEIAALGVVLGASFAGRRAMTATSGPGLSLMVELAGLAGMAEVPAVIVDVQRAGPSTGMPTKPEQGDLNLALFGAHGEPPRIVLAPTNVEECFYATLRAFDLADKYQLPVFVLSDHFLAKRRETFPLPPLDGIRHAGRLKPTAEELADYRRFRLTDTGISPMAIPGEANGWYVATGLEHTEAGAPSYDPEMHRQMAAKRARKLEQAAKELQMVRRFGAEDPEIGILGWGSTEGAVREAILRAREKGYKAACLYPLCLNPLPVKKINDFAKTVKKVIVPELNYSGQFAYLLRARCEVDPISLTIAEGRPVTAEEVLRMIELYAQREAA